MVMLSIMSLGCVGKDIMAAVESGKIVFGNVADVSGINDAFNFRFREQTKPTIMTVMARRVMLKMVTTMRPTKAISTARSVSMMSLMGICMKETSVIPSA